MATPCRHIFSGVAAAVLVAAGAWLGGVPTATASSLATGLEAVAPDSCPPSWPALHPGPPVAFDGNVSVLVGGSLRATGAAAGAEGTVVTLGDATFARDVPGAYEVGTTALGSQVTPYADSDMLVVGGSLTGGAGTHIDVGQSLGGDIVVGGAVAPGTDIDGHGGRLDAGVADATAPYRDLAAQLAGKSATYAAMPATGTADVTEGALTLTGDGVSDPQVFTLDASTLTTVPPDTNQIQGRDGDRGQHGGRHFGRDGASGGEGDGDGSLGRSLQVTGVPDGATVVVNLTGPAVDLDIDSLLTADGLPLDPQSDPAFAGLATHLLWNAPTATTVEVSGAAQLPGSLLVPTAPSVTTLSGQGTNGRILVGGDLVHTGTGELHAYPFLPDLQLACAGDPVHLTALTLDVVLVDPDNVVDPERYFEGRFSCALGGVDVTPATNTWKLRAGAVPRVLSSAIPSGASCTVSERLEAPPAPFRTWADPQFSPDVVVVAKREQKGIVITNKVKDLPPAPTNTPSPTPTQTPTQAPTQAAPPAPPPVVESPTALPTPTPSSLPEPTNRPTLPSTPSTVPTQAAEPTATSTVDADAPEAGGSDHHGPAGPLATTAPFTLRGAFVWGPLLMLSLLTLLLRVKRRPRREH